MDQRDRSSILLDFGGSLRSPTPAAAGLLAEGTYSERYDIELILWCRKKRIQISRFKRRTSLHSNKTFFYPAIITLLPPIPNEYIMVWTRH